MSARYSRNPVIVQVLADLGYVERLGYGLDRAVTSMRQNSLNPPEFEESAGTFRVTLHNTPTEDTPPEESQDQVDEEQQDYDAVTKPGEGE